MKQNPIEKQPIDLSSVMSTADVWYFSLQHKEHEVFSSSFTFLQFELGLEHLLGCSVKVVKDTNISFCSFVGNAEQSQIVSLVQDEENTKKTQFVPYSNSHF